MKNFLYGVVFGIMIYILSPIQAFGLKADIWCGGEWIQCEWYLDNNKWFVIGYGNNQLWVPGTWKWKG